MVSSLARTPRAFRSLLVACVSGAALAALVAACSSDGGGGAPATGGGAGSAGFAGFGGSGGFGGSAGTDAGAPDTGGDAPFDSGFQPDGYVPEPAPGDIDFQAVNALPSGSQLLFNDWSPSPNTVSSIKPDGTGETEIFKAYRVWSMGVSTAGDKIAFACGDPLQLEHYGLNLGDAIQNTWLYDVAGQTAKVISWGNLNDECHAWSADDANLYVCRRYDFEVLPGPKFQNKGYQLGRIAVGNGSFELLTPLPVMKLELHPQPNAAETELFYTLVEIAGGKQTRKIMKMALPGGSPAEVIANATLAQLSPDGTRLLYADSTAQSALFSAKVDGSDVVKVASRPGTSAVWSPDGLKVAYLWGETQSCHHIEVVAADGSEADTPLRVRDCKTSFITELEWIDKK